MPTPSEITSSLGTIANDAIALAVGWHVVMLMTGIALLLGWRPSRRLAGALLTLPLASVGILATIYRNPFNAVSMALLCVALVLLSRRLGSEPVELRSGLGTWMGAGMLVFGWIYPHFLDSSQPVFMYLYAAPTGLLPCPSLSVAVGYGLLCGGLKSRAWTLVLAVAGLFYGLFGVFRLGVYLDIALIAGAFVLGLDGVRHTRALRKAPSPPTSRWTMPQSCKAQSADAT